MCGIVGYFPEQGVSTDSKTMATRMTSQLVHRGPDSDGFVVGHDGVLGFRRLRIIDLETGEQPMPNEDETIWVQMNGEIYNFRELRSHLQNLGHRFRSMSDTEVVVHAYEQYGPQFAKHLRGMFAISIWDKTARKIFLVRDRIGKKPLFFFHKNGVFAFASTVRSLLELPVIPRAIDVRAIAFYLSLGYVPSPLSMVRDVNKLPPASILEMNLVNRIHSVSSYWELPRASARPQTLEEAKDAFLEKFKQAIKVRLVSDVPLGALLSGGIDSSLVVALMSAMVDSPVNTFTIGFEDAEFDERPYARLVAERYGTNHHELVINPDIAKVLPQLVRALDEPISDSSVLPTFFVSQMAKKHVTVVLNGDGGDENFGGYHHYRALLATDIMARYLGTTGCRVMELNFAIIEKLTRSGPIERIKNIFSQVRIPPWLRHKERMQLFNPAEALLLMRPEQKSHYSGVDTYFADLYRDSDKTDAVSAMLRADILSVLPEYLLVKMDRMAMAHSLEARSPLLDHELMEFTTTLPSRFKIKVGGRKVLLRSVAQDYLPSEILNRRKMGFLAPIGRWIREGLGDFARECLLGSGTRLGDWLEYSSVQSQVRALASDPENCWSKIWGLLVLELWIREILETPRIES